MNWTTLLVAAFAGLHGLALGYHLGRRACPVVAPSVPSPPRPAPLYGLPDVQPRPERRPSQDAWQAAQALDRLDADCYDPPPFWELTAAERLKLRNRKLRAIMEEHTA